MSNKEFFILIDNLFYTDGTSDSEFAVVLSCDKVLKALNLPLDTNCDLFSEQQLLEVESKFVSEFIDLHCNSVNKVIDSSKKYNVLILRPNMVAHMK